MTEDTTAAFTTDQKIVLYFERFVSNPNIYEIQWSGPEGQMKFFPSCNNRHLDGKCRIGIDDDPCTKCDFKDLVTLNLERAQNHPKSREIHAYYPLHDNGTLRFAALDFNQYHKIEDAILVLDKIRSFDVPAYLATSSTRGWHIYIFFENPIAAAPVIGFLQHVIGMARDERAKSGSEFLSPRIFPNSDKPGSSSGCIRTPLAPGRNVRSGRNCFLDPNLNYKPPQPDKQWEFFSQCESMDPTKLLLTLNEHQIPPLHSVPLIDDPEPKKTSRSTDYCSVALNKVEKIAQAIAPHWKMAKDQHRLSLAISGRMVSLGVEPKATENLFRLIYESIDEGDLDDWLLCLKSTVSRFEEGLSISGSPQLVELLGEKDAEAVEDILWSTIREDMIPRIKEKPKGNFSMLLHRCSALDAIAKKTFSENHDDAISAMLEFAIHTGNGMGILQNISTQDEDYDFGKAIRQSEQLRSQNTKPPTCREMMDRGLCEKHRPCLAPCVPMMRNDDDSWVINPEGVKSDHYPSPSPLRYARNEEYFHNPAEDLVMTGRDFERQEIGFGCKDWFFKFTNLYLPIGDIKTLDEVKAHLEIVYQDKAVIWKDKHRFESETKRRKICKSIKEKTQIDKERTERLDILLMDLDKKLLHELEAEEKERRQQKSKFSYRSMTKEQKKSAMDLLEKKKFMREVLNISDRMGVIGELRIRILTYLAYTSRITEEPVSLTIKGESSSGKSFSSSKITELMPPEAYKKLTDATPASFYHLPEDALMHKMVYINEMNGSERTDYAIRTAISEKDLILQFTHKNEKGQMEVIDKIVYGPVGFIMTTTKPMVHDENATRFLSLFTDDTPEQTRRTAQATVDKARGEDFTISDVEMDIWHNAQRLLKAYRVIIPFAESVFHSFPDRPVSIRRHREQFRMLLNCIVLIHQGSELNPNREVMDGPDGRKEIIGTVADYAIAKRVASTVMMETIFNFSPKARAIYKIFKRIHEDVPLDQRGSEALTYTRLMQEDELKDWSITMIRKWMKPLISSGFLSFVEGNEGGRGKKALIYLASKKPTTQFLPKVRDLYREFPCDKELFYDPFTGKSIDPETYDEDADEKDIGEEEDE